MIDTLGGILTIAGAGFIALAGLGVLRFHDVFNRMHSATKASTLGILLVSIGAALQVGDWAGGMKIFVAVVLIFITAPVAAHLVGRAAYPDWKRQQPRGGTDDLASRARRSADGGAER